MVPDERKIFSSHQYVSDGQVPGITHIVYIPPEAYTRLPSEADMVAVGEAVGRLNGLLPRRRFILVGPGRWGSRGDITLGVRVGYSDISNCSMLVEVARQKGGYTPEVSFGTHFFQDLVESRIRYLPLYPDRENTIFNEAFLMGSPSSLADLLPDFAYLEDVIRVISIEAAAPGCEMMVIMDGEKDEALGFLTDAPDRTSEEEIHEPPRRRNGGCE